MHILSLALDSCHCPSSGTPRVVSEPCTKPRHYPWEVRRKDEGQNIYGPLSTKDIGSQQKAGPWGRALPYRCGVLSPAHPHPQSSYTISQYSGDPKSPSYHRLQLTRPPSLPYSHSYLRGCASLPHCSGLVQQAFRTPLLADWTGPS